MHVATGNKLATGKARLLHLVLVSGVVGGKVAQVTSATRQTEHDTTRTKLQYESSSRLGF
jgi:hypothetical protein